MPSAAYFNRRFTGGCKSTIFNALTGLHQHTGNWPGKTISRAEGGFSYSEKRYKIVDLPGTYSLRSTSTDEQVVREFILFGQPDVTVVVCDATSLAKALASVKAAMREAGIVTPQQDWIALRLLESDPMIEDALGENTLGQLSEDNAGSVLGAQDATEGSPDKNPATEKR